VISLSDVMTDAADVSTVDAATYVEAMNYFCEMEMNEHRLQIQRESAMRSLSRDTNAMMSLTSDKSSAGVGQSRILQLVSSLY